MKINPYSKNFHNATSVPVEMNEYDESSNNSTPAATAETIFN